VCGRGPLNQTSKSNIFIFYSPPYPPLSFPSPVVIPARDAGSLRSPNPGSTRQIRRRPTSSAHRDDASPADPLHPRASGLRPRPSALTCRQSHEVAASRPRRRLASASASYLASSAHPANRRGRTWAGSLVVDNAAGRRRTWRLTARPGSGGRRGAGSASPLSSPLSLAHARWIAVLLCTAQFCGQLYLVRRRPRLDSVREGASCKYTKMQTGRTDGLYMLLGFSKK